MPFSLLASKELSLQPKKTKLSRKSLSSSLLGETETAQIPHEATSFVVVWMFCLLSTTPQACSIDELSTNDERGSDERRLNATYQLPQLVVRRQLIDAACGVLDSRQKTRTTANDVPPWQNRSLQNKNFSSTAWVFLAVVKSKENKEQLALPRALELYRAVAAATRPGW